MAFDFHDFSAPAGLRSDEFLLRPILTSDAELDYEAVMESREFLRTWEQSGWPEDDFTVEANREDMDKLERRHNERVSFTYTVMNLTETECLGCVYISPPDVPWIARAEITAVDGAQWSDYEAVVAFWVRQSRLADETDRRLLDALGPWLTDEWNIKGHLIVTNEQFEQQVEMLESASLHHKFELTYPNHLGKSLAFAG